MAFTVNEDETLEELQIKNLMILQKQDAFRFGMDAVVLANFAKVKTGADVVDLGTGSGILPLLLAAKTGARKIIGLEIQPDMADMAGRSVSGNQLEGRLEIRTMDIRECWKTLGKGKFDTVVSNPPYTRIGSGLVNPVEKKAIARHEVLCTLQDVVQAAANLLKFHGEFFMVHRPDRLCDIMVEMRNNRLEPKLLRLVCPRAGDPPSLILISGMKNGNPEMRVMPPLNIYAPSGEYTAEAKILYGIMDSGKDEDKHGITPSRTS